MKQFFLFSFSFFCLYSCNEQALPASDTNPVEEVKPTFDWLPGKWKRLNDKDGRQTFENWEKKNKTEYNGFAYTLKDEDTTWQETIQLIRTNDEWSFNVTGKGENEATKFKVTTLENKKFICENPANEFPKIIEYACPKDTLYAKISGSGMEVYFDFIKID